MKEELFEKAITFTAYKENGFREGPRNFELTKDRNTEEGNKGKVNGYTEASTNNVKHKVFPSSVDYVEQERKALALVSNVKYLHRSSTAYGNMIELV